MFLYASYTALIPLLYRSYTALNTDPGSESYRDDRTQNHTGMTEYKVKQHDRTQNHIGITEHKVKQHDRT